MLLLLLLKIALYQILRVSSFIDVDMKVSPAGPIPQKQPRQVPEVLFFSFWDRSKTGFSYSENNYEKNGAKRCLFQYQTRFRHEQPENLK